MHEIETESFAVAWSEMSIADEIMQKYCICLVAVDEVGVIHGHAYMRHIVNEGQITNLAVRRDSRNQGIGSLLVRGLIKAAKERAMLGLTLEVRKSNRAAISLYERHGFAPEGIRKNYYSQPSEDGIIMWKYFK
ncbi:MAG: ribosomal protein S18-alanine N-acetyltransferase [Defluviitaleaceae bacterium]|nr:ribosomal protein S18-alanine N-acetyltransferase [Defluviitaleaceae bacterium]